MSILTKCVTRKRKLTTNVIISFFFQFSTEYYTTSITKPGFAPFYPKNSPAVGRGHLDQPQGCLQYEQPSPCDLLSVLGSGSPPCHLAALPAKCSVLRPNVAPLLLQQLKCANVTCRHYALRRRTFQYGGTISSSLLVNVQILGHQCRAALQTPCDQVSILNHLPQKWLPSYASRVHVPAMRE